MFIIPKYSPWGSRRQLTPVFTNLPFPAVGNSPPDREIPDSRFIVYVPKRRFVPVCASLNRGFRGLLTPVFDKPAFSRFSQNCEPLIVVEIFGKIVKRQVCQKRG